MKRISYKLNIIQDAIAGVFGHKKELHTARFARTSELKALISYTFDEENSLLIGKDRFGHVLRICPSANRRELGNVLIEAPTRGGKGLLATAQLLSWKGSVVVNDIKGDLFTHTAGYRAQFSDVVVFDPTGVGHRYDPLTGKTVRGRAAVRLSPAAVSSG